MYVETKFNVEEVVDNTLDKHYIVRIASVVCVNETIILNFCLTWVNGDKYY
ncbi:MAG: hypothetical protein SOV57_07390 [Bacilli bacterium]|nr:hypothetical protein [Bacilli bacterium]